MQGPSLHLDYCCSRSSRRSCGVNKSLTRWITDCLGVAQSMLSHQREARSFLDDDRFLWKEYCIALRRSLKENHAIRPRGFANPAVSPTCGEYRVGLLHLLRLTAELSKILPWPGTRLSRTPPSLMSPSRSSLRSHVSTLLTADWPGRM